MWWTPDGERVLQGAEAQLFREALGVLVDMVRDDDVGVYYVAVPPDATDAEMAGINAALRRVTRQT